MWAQNFVVSKKKLRYTESYIFWDITPCCLLKVNRRFGGTCRLRLQDSRISPNNLMVNVDPEFRNFQEKMLYGFIYSEM
jgi:hypothetical protein